MIFKVLPFLTVALAIIFLLIALLAFSKNWKNILKTALIITGIFGVAFFYIRYINKLNNQFVPMTSTSMFKKLEYVEKLKLVSFYSEEVIVLGTKEKVQKRVDQLMLDSIKLAENERKIGAKLDTALKEIEKSTVDQHQNREGLKGSLAKLNLLYKNHKEVKKASFKDEELWEDEKRLLNDPNIYQSWMECKYNYDSLAINFETKPWKKRGEKKKRRDYKEELEGWKEKFIQSKRTIASRLQAKIILEESQYQNLKREHQKTEGIFKRQKKDAIAVVDEARKNWAKTIEKLQKVNYKLQEARMELAFAKEKGEDIEAEILIVVPAEISSYIDMAEVRIRKDESDTVHILLPPIQTDSVLIDLKDDAIYDLDDKDKLIATQQGAYFDIFGQLKDAILEKEQIIKSKAHENGIFSQGEEMAKSYLRNFINPMGYEVVFENEKKQIEN